MTNQFYYGNCGSGEMGIFLTSPPPRVIPARDISFIKVPGKNGDVVIDNGSYNNISLPFICTFKPKKTLSMREQSDSIAAWLSSQNGYKTLVHDYEPEFYRLALVDESTDIESIVEKLGKLEIAFNCKPQKYSFAGQQKIAINRSGQALFNPYKETALPLICLYGTGAGTLYINGKAAYVTGLSAPLFLDSETQNAYTKTENKNSAVNIPEFPALQSGANTIDFTGGITKLEIIARWWTI